MPNYGQSAQYIPAQAQQARAGFALPPQAQVPDIRAQQLAALVRSQIQPVPPVQAQPIIGGIQAPTMPSLPGGLPAQAKLPTLPQFPTQAPSQALGAFPRQ